MLGTNIILTGVPILTFAIFAFSVSIWSLLAGVIIGLGGALVFTLISISLAFFALLPTIVGMTALACLIAACGSTAYFVFERARGKTSTTAATAENEHGGVHQKKLGNSGNAPTQAVSADGLEKLRREHSKEKPTAAWLDQVTTAMQQQPGKPTSGMTNQSQVLRPAVEPGDSQTKVVDRSTSQKGHHERPRQVDGNVEGFNNLVRESGLAERKSSGIDEEIRREAREAAKREAMRLPHAKEVMPDD